MTPLAEIGRLLREERERQMPKPSLDDRIMRICTGHQPYDRDLSVARVYEMNRYAAELGCRIEVRLVREGEMVDGKHRHLGIFQDPIEAALAFDAAAKKLHGEFAVLNFPDPL